MCVCVCDIYHENGARCVWHTFVCVCSIYIIKMTLLVACVHDASVCRVCVCVCRVCVCAYLPSGCAQHMDKVRHLRLVHEESRARYVTLLDMDCQERSLISSCTLFSFSFSFSLSFLSLSLSLSRTHAYEHSRAPPCVPSSADAFYIEFNGKPYSSMDTERCVVLFVKDVLFLDHAPAADGSAAAKVCVCVCVCVCVYVCSLCLSFSY